MLVSFLPGNWRELAQQSGALKELRKGKSTSMTAGRRLSDTSKDRGEGGNRKSEEQPHAKCPARKSCAQFSNDACSVAAKDPHDVLEAGVIGDGFGSPQGEAWGSGEGGDFSRYSSLSSILWRFMSGLLSGIDCIPKGSLMASQVMKLLPVSQLRQGHALAYRWYWSGTYRRRKLPSVTVLGYTPGGSCRHGTGDGVSGCR